MVEPFINPEPLTVSVNAAPPATAVLGAMELKTGTGLVLVPPPFPAGVSDLLQDTTNRHKHTAAVNLIVFIRQLLKFGVFKIYKNIDNADQLINNIVVHSLTQLNQFQKIQNPSCFNRETCAQNPELNRDISLPTLPPNRD